MNLPLRPILFSTLCTLLACCFLSCEQPTTPEPPVREPEEEPTVLRLASPRDTTFEIAGMQFSMIYVQGGEFLMGATTNIDSYGYDPDADQTAESPVHDVYLSDYLIAQTETTQELFQAVMGYNPSQYRGFGAPVQNVSYFTALRFIDSLNKVTTFRFRLPTEAEWEYAAKAAGFDIDSLRFSGCASADEAAWYSENAGGMPHSCAMKKPNSLGLYDMSGNVAEWCSDWYDYYYGEPQENPQGPDMPYSMSRQRRVLRGGAFNQSSFYQRSTARQSHFPSNETAEMGFRVAISVK